MQQIGFIGVGAMGEAIVARLRKNNVPVLAYDINPQALERVRALGADTAASVREVVDRLEVVFACLPDASVCQKVALGPGGVHEGSKVRIYADTSTVGGATATAIGAGLGKRDIGFLDAPVVGGVISVQAGTLGVLVDGSPAAFTRVKPVLEAFAGRVFYLGEQPGVAQVGKVVNNAVGYAALYATFEAVAVGLKAGIDIETLVAIINQGSGANFHTQKIFPAYIIPRRFEGTGAVEIGVKDLNCFLQEARRLHAETPMADSVAELGARAAQAGPAGRDTMTLFHYFCDLAGVPRLG